MRKMHKWLSLTCVVCLVASTLALGGCGDKDQETSNITGSSARTESLSAEAEMEDLSVVEEEMSAVEEETVEETKAEDTKAEETKTENTKTESKDSDKSGNSSSSKSDSASSSSSSNSSSSSGSSSSSTTTEKTEEPAAPTISTGTYSGSHIKYVDAMDANIYYSYTIKINSDNTYKYTVKYYTDMSGQSTETVTETESGSYSVSGNAISFNGGKGSSGTWSDGSITVSRHVSERSSDKASITVSK